MTRKTLPVEKGTRTFTGEMADPVDGRRLPRGESSTYFPTRISRSWQLARCLGNRAAWNYQEKRGVRSCHRTRQKKKMMTKLGLLPPAPEFNLNANLTRTNPPPPPPPRSFDDAHTQSRRPFNCTHVPVCSHPRLSVCLAHTYSLADSREAVASQRRGQLLSRRRRRV